MDSLLIARDITNIQIITKKRPADAHAAGGLFWFARENEGFPPIFKVLRLAWEMKKLNEQNYKTTCIR